MKSGNLNFLEPSGLLQACNGTALPFKERGNFCYFRPKVLIRIVFCRIQNVGSGLGNIKAHSNQLWGSSVITKGFSARVNIPIREAEQSSPLNAKRQNG